MRQVNSLPLGGLSAAAFMKTHWQKRPLLVRGAFKDFSSTLEPFRPADVLALATRDDAESRLVQHEGRQWQLDHGPFLKRDLARLGPRDWTVLVQDTQHFSLAAEALLAQLPRVEPTPICMYLVPQADGSGRIVHSTVGGRPPAVFMRDLVQAQSATAGWDFSTRSIS